MNLSLVFGILLAVSSVCRGQGTSDEGQGTSDGGDGYYYYYPEQPSYPERPVINQAWTEGVCSKACNGGKRTDTRPCNDFPNCVEEMVVDCNQRSCKDAAMQCGSGVQTTYDVADSQIRASSHWHNSGESYNEVHNQKHGRLFNHNGIGAWAAYRNENQWIEVDYLTDKTITGVATQGRHKACPNSTKCLQWVTKYAVMYKVDGGHGYQFVNNKNGSKKVFNGNRDRDTVVAHNFPAPVTARYFRIMPLAWHQHTTLRFDFLTC